MDDGSPALEVGFAIDTGSSFTELERLRAIMNSSEATALKAAAEVERAFGQLNLAGATTSVTAYGNATTREMQNIRRDTTAAEKAGEALVRQLDRQASTFGKTREEIRAMKVETAALAAEQRGLTELSERLRGQQAALVAQEQAAAAAVESQTRAVREAAAAYTMFEVAARGGMAAYGQQQAREAAAAKQAEAQALREAAFAYNMFEAAARRGSAAAAAAVAQEREMGAAAAQLRASLDPMFAAQQRFDAELTRAEQLLAAGVISTREYDQAQQHARDTLGAHARAVAGSGAAVAATSAATRQFTSTAGANRAALQGLSFQVQDTFTQISMGANVLSVLAIQGGQAAGQMANLESRLGTVARFMIGPWGLAITAAMLVLGSLMKGMSETSDTADKATEAQKAHAEAVKALQDSVDRLNGSLAAVNHTTRQGIVDDLNAAEATRQLEIRRRGLLDVLLQEQQAKLGAARATQGAGGGSVPGSMFGVGVGQEASVNAQIAATKEAIALNAKRTADANNAISGAKTALVMRYVAASTDAATAATQRYQDAQDKLDRQFQATGHGGLSEAAYRTQSLRLKQAELAEQKAIADAKNKPNGPSAEETHAAALGREADAIGAQIRNLYALSDAYGVSGAAALIAEARVKAESRAIKQRGDIDAAVARQVALAIAQRVSDAEKSSAAMTEQAKIQAQVNAAVAAGTVPAEQAAQLLRDRLADLPLLAAIEAANATKNTDAATRTAKALDEQRVAREALADTERDAAVLATTAAGNDRLAELREELRLVGATDAARVHALATLKATREAAAKGWTGPEGAAWVKQQVQIADETEQLAAAQRDWNDALSFTADKWDLIARNVENAGRGMADAFGGAGRAIGDLASIYAGYQADRHRLDLQHKRDIEQAGKSQSAIDRANVKFALASSTQQIGAFGDMAAAAKGFFDEKSKGYKAIQAAEQVFRAFEFAMSVRSMVQDAVETVSSVTNSGARAVAAGAEGVAHQSKLPFPYNIAAMAATAAALVAAGIAVLGGGGGHVADPGNTGTGTVLGDSSAKSDSIKNAIDALKEVDTLTNSFAREMAASLRSIDSQIGGVASLISRGGAVDASAGVTTGFDNSSGKTIGAIAGAVVLGPIGAVLGGLIGSLFGTRTDVLGGGIYGKPQTIGNVVGGGYDGQTYSDVQKTHKIFGIVSGRSNSTVYGALDPTLNNQFTLILQSFNDAIAAAAGPLGAATSDIQARLNGFVIDIGKIDLKGLTGTEIEEKLNAVFGAAADGMANAAFPGIERFQKVGEGAFETLVRVASTVEAVTNAIDLLGGATASLGVDAKIGLANQFDSVSALSSAADAYSQAFYTKEEQAAAKTAQFAKVFDSLGLAMPATLAGFRQLVDAQNLSTAAGQATYATLLQLAPAFADLQSSMDGAKSAADILSERQDLQRQLLELQGDTAALRALDLAKLDASNRALQQQVWAVQDAQEAAKAAKDLSDAWKSVGDSISDEVNRLRGLTGTSADGRFSSLLGRFNAANTAARGGDIDAAKSLPGLSKELLTAAALVATSRQELDRVQAQTAATLEATTAAISSLSTGKATSNPTILDAASTTQAASAPTAANDELAAEVRNLRTEIAQMRLDNNAGHAATASNTGSIKRSLDAVTQDSGGESISVAVAA